MRSIARLVPVVAVATMASVLATVGPARAVPTDVVTDTRVESVGLITGDRVLVGTDDKHPTVRVIPAEPDAWTSNMTRTSMGGDVYVIPAEARPFLGSVLNPELFNVSALAQSPDDTISVAVTTTNMTAPHIPGFTLSRRQNDVYLGTFSLRSTTAFRKALAAAALRSAHTAGRELFNGVTSIAPADARGHHEAEPKFAQQTLNLRTLGPDGKPVQTDVAVVNMDDSKRYSRYVLTPDGSARLSLPVGHYALVTQFDSFSSTALTNTNVVTVSDYTVSRNEQTVTLDARSATAAPSVTTPKTATMQRQVFEVDRIPKAVGASGLTWTADSDASTSVRVTPVAKAITGALYTVNAFYLTGETTPTAPYSYDLSFLHSGSVPASLHEVVRTADLATVKSSYYDSNSGGMKKSRVAVYPFQALSGASAAAIPAPAKRTEYIEGPSNILWSDSLTTFTPKGYYDATIFDRLRTHPAKSKASVDWLRGPLAAGVGEPVAHDVDYHCTACRTAGALTVIMSDLQDSTPGHAGYLTPAAGENLSHLDVVKNGQVISTADNTFRTTIPVAADESAYTIHYTVNREAHGATTSSSSATTLRFLSSATNGAKLPSGWACTLAEPKDCQVLPILTEHTALPTTLTNTLAAGKVTFPVVISGLAGAAAPIINSAFVGISIDGVNYLPATLKRTANGRYLATIDTPKAWEGQPVTVRTEATSVAGSSINEVTTAAYTVSSHS